MNTPQLITRRSLDQLETDIISLSSHINSMEYEFLVLLREFYLLQGYPGAMPIVHVAHHATRC